MNRDSFTDKFDSLFKSEEPFFFLINYKLSAFHIIPFSELHNFSNTLQFKLPHEFMVNSPWLAPLGDLHFNSTKKNTKTASAPPLFFTKYPLHLDDYRTQFEKVQSEIRAGNTYLLNLTTSTLVETNLSLEEIYTQAHHALLNNYLLYFAESDLSFVSFSPETFITIKDQTISAYPMKGTYTHYHEATEAIHDPKELYEQTTVVDRVRNDLSLVSDRVRVTGFLTPQEVTTHSNTIYQTISTITGSLGERFYASPGAGLLSLLPAASITGAPKIKTVEIINRVETHERGYYTGIWGVAGKGELYSAVIIRYLEEQNGKSTQPRSKYYKSGGGITFMSEVEKEYAELITKIYLPFKWKTLSSPTSHTGADLPNASKQVPEESVLGS